jgi:hypothetical protein
VLLPEQLTLLYKKKREKMFEKASRIKLRFNSSKGRLSIEDLWDLKLKELDDLTRAIYQELKEKGEKSFITETPEIDEKLQLKFDILKHIILIKLDEQAAAENAFKIKMRKQQILEIIADKEIEDLKIKDISELKALLKEL